MLAWEHLRSGCRGNISQRFQCIVKPGPDSRYLLCFYTMKRQQLCPFWCVFIKRYFYHTREYFKMNVTRVSLHYSQLEKDTRFYYSAKKTLKETMSAICICLFSAHHGHGSVDHNNTSSSAEQLHGGHGNNRPRLRSHANNTLPTEQHHSHLPVSIMGGGTSRWGG